MSTSARSSPIVKKLSARVRPGVLLVRARPLTPVSALISELLPTLERPAIATSIRSHWGHSATANAEATNCAWIFIARALLRLIVGFIISISNVERFPQVGHLRDEDPADDPLHQCVGHRQ